MSMPVKVESSVQIGLLRYPLSQVGHQPLAPIISDPKLTTALEQAARRVGRDCDLNFLYRTGHTQLKELGLGSKEIARTQAIQRTLGIEGQRLIIDGAWSSADQAALKRRLLALSADLDRPTKIKQGKTTRTKAKPNSRQGKKETRLVNFKDSHVRCEEAQRRDKWKHAANPLVAMEEIHSRLEQKTARTVEEAGKQTGLSPTHAHTLDKLRRGLDPTVQPRLDPSVGYERWLSLSAAEVIFRLEPALQRSLVEQLDQAEKILSGNNLRLALAELRSPGQGGGQALAEIIRQLRIALFCLEKLDQAEIKKIPLATRSELEKSFREVLTRLTRAGQKLETK